MAGNAGLTAAAIAIRAVGGVAHVSNDARLAFRNRLGGRFATHPKEGEKRHSTPPRAPSD